MLSCVIVQAQYWQCNIRNYQYDMTVYATLRLDGVSISASNEYEIAAFCGEECRGVATVETLADDVPYYYLRVRSNASEGEKISFKCYNVTTQKEIPLTNTLDFESQVRHGYPSEPVLFTDTNMLKGDVNGDNTIDIQDVVSTVNLMLKGTYNVLADVNNDDVVDIQDVVAVVNLMLKA